MFHHLSAVLSRLLSATVITFNGTLCVAIKGRVPARILQDAADCLHDEGVNHAEIRIGGDRRIRFSREIPPVLHQRLRNILAQI